MEKFRSSCKFLNILLAGSIFLTASFIPKIWSEYEFLIVPGETYKSFEEICLKAGYQMSNHLKNPAEFDPIGIKVFLFFLLATLFVAFILGQILYVSYKIYSNNPYSKSTYNSLKYLSFSLYTFALFPTIEYHLNIEIIRMFQGCPLADVINSMRTISILHNFMGSTNLRFFSLQINMIMVLSATFVYLLYRVFEYGTYLQTEFESTI